MRRGIIRQDQYERPAIAHEIARHSPNEAGLVRYILVRNLSTISIVMSGRRLTNSGPQLFMLFSYEWLGSSGRNPLGCASTAATIRLGARFRRFQIKGPPMQMNPLMSG